MRVTTFLLAGLALTAACRGGDGDGTDGTNTEDIVDTELLEQVGAEWQTKANLDNMTVELVTDARDCDVPRWWFAQPYNYNPETLKGDGIHMVDLSYPIDQFEENTPRIVMYNIEQDGTYTLAGLEWYFEPPGQEPLAEQPTLFGVPMDGMMEPHVPGRQQLHYDLHGWIWITSPDNDYGYFNAFNEAMEPPPFWWDYEPTVFDSFKFFDPTVREGLGYVMGDCADTEGVRYTNDALVGQLDPFAPDTLFYDVNGIWLGQQWTIHESEVTEVPTLHEQTFAGPDADGNYYLRTWMGSRVNPDGMFADSHRFVSCNEPAIPADCM